MKASQLVLVVFLGSQLLKTEAFSFSLGLVGLGVAGLTGLRLYLGVKMFAPRFSHRRSGNHHDQWNSSSDNQNFQLDLNITLPEAPERPQRDSLMKYRARRSPSGGMKLSKDFLRWLRSIDDDKCIHRFFCDLGADRSRFGNLGQLTTVFISMGGLPRGSWAQEMFDAGKGGKPCHKSCDDHELWKTIDYLERRLFAVLPPGVDSETEENEILT